MNNKRETLKKVASVSAVLALAPSSWTKPVINSIVLPSHAQTSTMLSLDAVEDILIVDKLSNDPRVRTTFFPTTQGPLYLYSFDVIQGSEIDENTVFTLINNPTIGENIGDLDIEGRGRFTRLGWNIEISKFGPPFGDSFPSGDYLISVLAQNSDGGLAQVNFNITWR